VSRNSSHPLLCRHKVHLPSRLPPDLAALVVRRVRGCVKRWTDNLEYALREYLLGRKLARWVFTLLFCLPVAAQSPPVYSGGVPLQFKLSNDQLFPGDILRFAITAGRAIGRAEASFAGQRVVFYEIVGGREWIGLVGVDLETKAGHYSIQGVLTFEDGGSQPFERHVQIVPKRFPVQRISVEEKYVTLSPEDSRRAEQESKKLEAIWKISSGPKLWEGRFLKPVATELSSGFGRRRIVNNKPRSPHSGVDLKAKAGTAIVAANCGRVVLAEDLFYSGQTIVLDHGLGLYTFYGHCSKLEVKRGEIIKKGEVIAEVGSTGRVTGPHLHWACRISEARIDPIKLTSFLLGD
jgi:murein DD-endopeptidase MepM/ murein hydrolase activator NlpD